MEQQLNRTTQFEKNNNMDKNQKLHTGEQKMANLKNYKVGEQKTTAW